MIRFVKVLLWAVVAFGLGHLMQRMPAIAEAVRHLKVPLERIDVLSVGTMGNEVDFTESLGKGKAGWAPTSADLFFAAQEHAAASLAEKCISV